MIDKELQDHVWKYFLPKEFKEEVKSQFQQLTRIWSSHNESKRMLLINIFGIDNLTSDAEGEEMLTMSRKRVQELYSSYCTERDEEEPGSNRSSLGGRIAMLQELFDSKCLPDETCNVASSDVASNVASSKPKPAEPKFKVGDKVRIISLQGRPTSDKGNVDVIAHINTGNEEQMYYLENHYHCAYGFSESDLEPYTEPEEKLGMDARGWFRIDTDVIGNKIKVRIPSGVTEPYTEPEEVNKHFDNILKDGFTKERRLNIAVQVLCAIIPKYKDIFDGIRLSVQGEKDMIKDAFRITDALIKESEKGGES